MVVLFIDTCNRLLGVGLEKDGKLIYKKEYDMFKYLEYEIVRLIDDENISPESIVILSDHDNYEKILTLFVNNWNFNPKFTSLIYFTINSVLKSMFF
mgnify:CR=1 FL=1